MARQNRHYGAADSRRKRRGRDVCGDNCSRSSRGRCCDTICGGSGGGRGEVGGEVTHRRKLQLLAAVVTATIPIALSTLVVVVVVGAVTAKNGNVKGKAQKANEGGEELRQGGER